MDHQAIVDRIRELGGIPPSPLVVKSNAGDFTAIDHGHVLRIADRTFLVRGCAYEGRFGIEASPKFWVKWALDLDSGQTKLLKFPFQETFSLQLGVLRVPCVRDPEKEGRVLRLVHGDNRFMQGRTLCDDDGHPVHVLDILPGPNLYDEVRQDMRPHGEYFRLVFPGLLRRVRAALDAMAWLNRHGERHGDIRNDHLIVDPDTGRLGWIDFDLSVAAADIDVHCAGNVLLFVVAQGIVTFADARHALPPDAADPLVPADAALFFSNRVANLRKLYPYLPEGLNDLLMRYSVDAREPFATLDEVVAALDDVLRDLPPAEDAP
jgi:hypothetical protein